MKNALCTGAGIVGSAIAALFGGWDAALVTLIIFMGVDYGNGYAHQARIFQYRNSLIGNKEDEQQAGADLVSICETFCTAIEKAGLYVGVYSALSWWNTKLFAEISALLK